MEFVASDLLLILAYFILTVGIGLYFGRKGGRSLADYFLSGRGAPWWLAGTGMVATTFAADTPLAVAGIVADDGIAGNWIWWSAAIGGTLTVFFFAKLWVRSGVVTDLELVEIRYAGPFAAFLRGFRAVYFGIFVNVIVIGWVNLAMLKILRVTFPDTSPELLLVLFGGLTLFYVTFTGLGGVAAADVFQFLVAMTGSIVLAILAVDAVGGIDTLVGSVSPERLAFLPSLDETNGFSPGFWTFFTFVAVQWWASWYPGAEPGGGGYVAQRILSAKSENDGILATLWFIVAHYAVRPWPWIVAGLAATILYPNLQGADRESGYVFLMRDILPSPYRGLLIAAFAGAYMSTLSTQLNWGASYAVNDFYARFVRPGKNDSHYVMVGRWVTLFIFILSLFVTFYVLESISGAWKLLLEFGAGSGFILILRWFWWRINALTELVSVIAPVVLVLAIRFLIPSENDTRWISFISEYPGSLLVVSGATVVLSLITAFLSTPESEEVLKSFAQKVQPPGPGWNPIYRILPAGSYKRRPLWPLFLGWLGGLITVYSLLFSTGSFLLVGVFAGVAWGLGFLAGVILLSFLFVTKRI